jgi:hypothetical protein
MLDRRTAVLLIGASGLVAFAATTARAGDLKSPDQVKTALRLMMLVTNDFDRQINHKTYARLPHENMEFHEACGALSMAIAGEPAGFVAKVELAVKRALAAAQKVADDSSAGDDAQLRAGHAELVKAINVVFDYFPEALRPDPNVQPGPHPPGPPPP